MSEQQRDVQRQIDRLTMARDAWMVRAEKAEKALGEQCDGSGNLPDYDYVDHVAIPSARNCPGCRYCAEAEVTRLKASMLWQPIESAPPKTIVLAWSPYYGVCVVRRPLGRWISVPSELVRDDVTHWMPLPAAPDAQKAGE